MSKKKKNKGKIFTKIQCEDDDYGYLSVDDYKNIECEETNCKIVDIKNGKFYDVSILRRFCRYIGKYVKVDGIGRYYERKKFSRDDIFEILKKRIVTLEYEPEKF